jgi:hypothetical protein
MKIQIWYILIIYKKKIKTGKKKIKKAKKIKKTKKIKNTKKR